MSDERRYSEAELRAIIERAAQRQESERRARDAGEGGLTLAELQQIGATSGIDPVHIATAASELAYASPSEKPDALVGMPTSLRWSRFIPSEVSDAAWMRIVTALRREFDKSGVAGEVGAVREWTSQVRNKSGGAVHVVLEPVDGGSLVTIEQSWRGSAWAGTGLAIGYAFTSVVLGALLLAGQLDPGDATITAVFALFAALAFAGTQVGTRIYAKRQDRRFKHALDRIELIAREEADAAAVADPETTMPSVSTSTEVAAQKASRLDLDALPDEADGVHVAPRDRTRS